MGAGARLPGVILLLAAVVLLALVSFNVPMLKGFYFLEGRFTSGSFKGTLRLGTLGYCATGDVEECVGPKIGYSFDLNTILGIPKNLINIPSAVSKYLTYVLIAHVIALCFAAIGFVMALLDLIPGCNMVCFPTCMASIAASITLIAFIFDLAIFFIAKAAIGKASGAEATIGPAVWMTLAAWVCCTVSICAFGMANCCCSCGSSSRDRESRRDRKRRKRDAEDSFDDYRRDNDMRMHAIRDEERRKYEQDLPSFQPYEREPLNRTPPEDKYLYDEAPPAGGTGVNGVGVGYGPRNPYAAAAPVAYGQNLSVQRQPSTGSSMLTAGNAGVGAGGEGIDQPRNQYGYAGQREQMAENNYYDPYAASGPAYEYAQAQGAGNPAYPPVAGGMTSPPHQQRGNDYFSGGPGSSDSHYRDPGPRVQHADPYQSTPYDDGLGAIGRAATSPTGEQQYTGAQGYGGGYGGAAVPAPLSIPSANTTVQVPTPQRLVNPTQSNILRSPDSEYSTAAAFNMPESDAPGPPSYGQATHNAPAAASSYPQEKR